MTETNINNAKLLVVSLEREKHHWQEQQRTNKYDTECFLIDCTIAAAFIIYSGPHDHEGRRRLFQAWKDVVGEAELPSHLFPNSNDMQSATAASVHDLLVHLLAKPTEVEAWHVRSLPRDRNSTLNGLLVEFNAERLKRPPLLIDPQGQAVRWLTSMESFGDCLTFDLSKLLPPVDSNDEKGTNKRAQER